MGLTIFGEYHEDNLIYYTNIGVCFCNLRDYDNALVNLNKAIEIYDIICGGKFSKFDKNNNAHIIETYKYLGIVHLYFGKHHDAIECMSKSVVICNTLNGDDNVETVEILFCIGIIFKALGNIQKSLEYFKRILHILKVNSISDNNIFTLMIHENIQNISLEPLEYFNKFFRLLEDFPITESLSFVLVVDEIIRHI